MDELGRSYVGRRGFIFQSNEIYGGLTGIYMIMALWVLSLKII